MGRVTVKHFIQQLSSVSLLGNNVFEIPCKHLTKGLVSIFGSFGIILRAKYGNHKPNPVCSRASQEILLSLTLIIMGWYFFILQSILQYCWVVLVILGTFCVSGFYILARYLIVMLLCLGYYCMCFQISRWSWLIIKFYTYLLAWLEAY